ncbi:MAG: LLM class flavin-dependent oxidoreductase [Acidimicrobiia bacterium]|nr:LLM class flavin-dependent oxidoreductase [Acidimicrobiia bacterium]
MAATAMRFDLRRAPFSTVTEADQHAQCIAMARWADEHGFAAVTISEHHGVDFVSAPTALAGALLGATRNVHVMVNALLVPLHDPVRLAEEVATLDLVSGGRFTFVAGLGYRPEEFAMAGVDRRRRGAIVEEHIEVLLQAWSGEPFEWQGRTIEVHPTPARPPGHLMWLGGSVRRSAERAARLRLPFFTMSTDPSLGDAYREACADEDFEGGAFMSPIGPLFVHVAEDPEQAWAEIAPYAVYDVTTYNAWQTGDHDNVAASSATTAEQLRASGMWKVVTPDECVELAQRDGTVVLHPLMGGMPPELGWESLELVADQVLPALANM